MNPADHFDAKYRPIRLQLDHRSPESENHYNILETGRKEGRLIDLFQSQKKELIRLRYPGRQWTGEALEAACNEQPGPAGAWFYYPWSGRLLHILDEAEFSEVRTGRNRYKIRPDEQESLSQKVIGIIGLSVGHAVAVTLATERICGKLKLADFDTLELSNLNRIRTGLHQIGLNKCILTAREIAEIDPYIDIECYTEGINRDNLDAFLADGRPLDLLIDECDDLEVKILCRQKAQQYRIPVIMETSDRGMLDVERFDLEPARPIFHGLLADVPADKLTNISAAARIPLVLKIVNAANGSLRGRLSMIEIGQSISTWPQLASAVALGGGVVTDVGRRVLLDQYRDSGRYYVDIESLVTDNPAENSAAANHNPFLPFDLQQAVNIADQLPHAQEVVEEDALKSIVEAACLAPSTGNDQPWKWVYRHGNLLLFHDPYRAYSFGNFQNIASNISLGACYENLLIKSDALGYIVEAALFPRQDVPDLTAVITFRRKDHSARSPFSSDQFVNAIYTRNTNRNPSRPVPLDDTCLSALKDAAESLEDARLFWLTDPSQIEELGNIIGECDRIRLLNPEGHYDFVNREMRWTGQSADDTGDGIDIRTLGLQGSETIALSLVKDARISGELKKIRGGNALVQAAVRTVTGASAIGLIVMPDYTETGFFRGGRAMQRLWLRAEIENLAVHPVISPLYLFPRVLHGQGEGLDSEETFRLGQLRERFLRIFPLEEGLAEVFLFKIALAEPATIKSRRLPLNKTLFIKNPQ